MKNIFLVVISFIAGMSLAGKTYLPLVSASGTIDHAIVFDGQFNLYDDGTGFCQGNFLIHPILWNQFKGGAELHNSVWFGLAELIDGYPHGPDEDSELYQYIWSIADYLEEEHNWAYYSIYH